MLWEGGYVRSASTSQGRAIAVGGETGCQYSMLGAYGFRVAWAKILMICWLTSLEMEAYHLSGRALALQCAAASCSRCGRDSVLLPYPYLPWHWARVFTPFPDRAGCWVAVFSACSNRNGTCETRPGFWNMTIVISYFSLSSWPNDGKFLHRHVYLVTFLETCVI